jgi:peptidoglycan/LPS O-acetylase OafA/YrhL
MAIGTGPHGRHEHFEQLDRQRGFAALLIVLHHAYLQVRDERGGYLYAGTPLHLLFVNLDAAVTWFFVLSGFLMFLPFARAALAQRSPIPVRRFLIRRALRILPVYYVAILLFWSWQFFRRGASWRDLAQHLTFTHVFDRTNFYGIVDPAWSLGIEGLFYLLLAVLGPLFFRACGRVAAERGRLLLLCGGSALLGALSLAYKFVAYAVARVPLDDTPVYWGPLAKLDAFALGMLLAVAYLAARGRIVRHGHALRRAGWGVLALACCVRLTGGAAWVFFGSFCALACAAILAASILGPQPQRRGQTLVEVLGGALGGISYSLYLWHKPLLIEVTRGQPVSCSGTPGFLVMVGIFATSASLVAAISYWGVERPALRLRRHLERAGRYAATPAAPIRRPAFARLVGWRWSR